MKAWWFEILTGRKTVLLARDSGSGAIEIVNIARTHAQFAELQAGATPLITHPAGKPAGFAQ
jgi:hypothetical protein